MRDLVSIVIPVYNTEKYISRCLESIINQSYNQLQIIVIDDGSTDGIMDIIKEFEKKDNRIMVISGENRGVSYARNKGLSYAEGEKIVFFDSDDIMDMYAIEKMYKAIQGYDLVVGSFIEVDENENVIDECIMHQDIFDCSIKHDLVSMMNINPFPNNKMFRTEIIKTNNIQWPQVSLGEDQGFYLSYLCMCKGVNVIKDSVFKYRIVSNSASHKTDVHILDINKGFDYAYQFANCNKVKGTFFENLYNRRINNYWIQFIKYVRFPQKRDREKVFFTLYNMINNVANEGENFLTEESQFMVRDVRKKYKYRKIYLSKAYLVYNKVKERTLR